MPVGDVFYLTAERPGRKYLTRLLGIHDLHSHLRIRPLISYMSHHYRATRVRILEVGCGCGINAFEVFKRNRNIEYHGFDQNPRAIQEAITVSEGLHATGHIHFSCEDATQYVCEGKGYFDILILMDVIEHLENPISFLRKTQGMLGVSGTILVSVPTPLYRRVFGQRFHNSVGHLRDGYTLDELTQLLAQIGYENVEHNYNTGLFSNVGCFFEYRRRSRKYGTLRRLIFHPFKFIDVFNGPKISCSLFAVFKKTACPVPR